MSTWKTTTLSVTNDLRLDPTNVRLDRDSHNAPEGDIIRDLFLNEGAMSLARGIANVGWLTHERPVVLKENGKWIVVEGNRRTAALKALHNPRSVPASFTELSALAKQIPNLKTLESIEVLIAPDRPSADELVANIHTANPRRAWSPLRRADFFYAQVEFKGATVQELKKRYPSADVPKYIEMAEMQKLLRTVKYADPVLNEFVSKKSFPISVFDRLYSNDKFLDLAKISVDKTTGHVTTSGNIQDFAKLATKVVSDIRNKKIDTRILNKPELPDYKKYMKELSGLAVKKDAGAPVPVLSKLIVPVNPHKARLTLDTSALKGVDGFPAVERILDELARLKYRDFPNATFDLLRTFIEKSIKAHAESLGESIPTKRGQVSFDDTLAYLQDKITASGDRALVPAMQKLRSTRSFTNFQLSKEALDAANHNPHIFMSPEDVKDLWDSLPGVLKFYLKK
jgi:hypothetical protein